MDYSAIVLRRSDDGITEVIEAPDRVAFSFQLLSQADPGVLRTNGEGDLEVCGAYTYHPAAVDLANQALVCVRVDSC